MNNLKLDPRWSILAVMSCLVVSAEANAGNLIQNGDFEAPLEPGTGVYSYFTPSPNVPPTGWTGGADIFQVPASASPFLFAGIEWPAAENGIQYEDIGTYLYAPALTQVVDVPQAGNYTLTWYDNDAFGFAYNYEVLLNGNVEATPSGVGGPSWTSRSIVLNLSAGDNTLAFLGEPRYDTLIDNVDLEANNAVPDGGATLYFLGMSVVGVAALRRRLA